MSALPTRDALEALRAALAARGLEVASAPADTWAYGSDNSRRHAPPDLVAFPRSHDEVAAIVALCHAHRVPLTTRGRGTATTGAAVPVQGGLVLSLERMARILELRPDDRLMVVEAGCLNGAVQEAAAPHGLFWPPDPTSAEYCTVGGNVATNAGGPRSVKHGTTRDCVLGLRAVTGAGVELRTGVRTTKGVVGYDLTRLLCGAEGTLAVVTEVTLELQPLPAATRTLRASYASATAAGAAVAAVMRQPVVPCRVELLDRGSLDMIRADRPEAGLPEGVGALLLIEVDGSQQVLDEALAAVAAAARVEGLVELRAARDAAESAALWAVRKALSPALRKVAPTKVNEDVVVPVSRLAELIGTVEGIGREHGVRIVMFGHAGNGNLHVNLMFDGADPAQAAAAGRALAAVFRAVLALGGTLSGEHGIGSEKARFVGLELDATQMALMRTLKQVFDPAGILNPGKIFPA
jgi:D-lactate dehydrogenase